ncbi:MAG: hypothetical protein K8S55_02820 [Phycisphaerae bacterium]|nr:hypothetical protein [Phycisphaerae bacterium]
MRKFIVVGSSLFLSLFVTAMPLLGDEKDYLMKEIRKASSEGYCVKPIEQLLDTNTPQIVSREMKIDLAKAQVECVRRAKGMLVSLKLPVWGHDFAFGDRQVHHYERTWGTCFSVARPLPDIIKNIDKSHAAGKKATFYIEGCLAPTTMLLMPGRVAWKTPCSDWYANYYWHRRDEWLGFSGTSKEHQRWIGQQLKLLAELGFDGGYVDSTLSSQNNVLEVDSRRNKQYLASGGWTEIQKMIREYPDFVVGMNGYSNPYIDDAVLKYNMLPMCEFGASPSNWAAFRNTVNGFSLVCYNTPGILWDEMERALKKAKVPANKRQGYVDLGYAVSISHKISPCARKTSISPKIKTFAHTYSDYIFSPFCEVYIAQNRVACEVEHFLALRRHDNGKKDAILHIYSTTPEKILKNVKVKINLKDLPLPKPLTLTYLRPGKKPEQLKFNETGGNLETVIPEVDAWGIMIVGAPLFPQIKTVEVQKRAKGGTYIVPLKIKNPFQRNYSISFLCPSGWSATSTTKLPAEKSFALPVKVSVPADCPNGLYAITPVLTDEFGNKMATWPIQFKVEKSLSFRFYPPFIRTPSKKPKTVKLEITNNTNVKFSGNVAVSFPKGWIKEKRLNTVRIAPREKAFLEISIQPQDCRIKLWDFKDIPVEFKWDFGGKKESYKGFLRALPSFFYVFGSDPLNIFREGEYRPTGFEQTIVMEMSSADALRNLEDNYGTLWITKENYAEHKGRIREFLKKGGGGVVTGVSIEEKDILPVEIGEEKTKEHLKLLKSPLTEDICRLRKSFAGKFKAKEIKPKKWGKVIATWGDGTPAIVVSQKPGMRVAFVASRLEGDYEFGCRGKKTVNEKWKKNLWLISALYSELFRWSAGIQ